MLNSRRAALMIGMAAAALLTAGAMITSSYYAQSASAMSKTQSPPSAPSTLAAVSRTQD